MFEYGNGIRGYDDGGNRRKFARARAFFERDTKSFRLIFVRKIDFRIIILRNKSTILLHPMCIK